MFKSTLRMPRNIHYGEDAFTKLGNEASFLGNKGLIISDPIMEKLGNVQKCQDALKEKKIESVKYLNIRTEPTDEYVLEALELFKKEECEFILVIGGGSCIDTAKGVSVI